jgi:hypothetical protein
MRMFACVVFAVCLGFSGMAAAMGGGGGGGGGAGGGGGGAAGGGGAGVGSAGVPWHEATPPIDASSRSPMNRQRVPNSDHPQLKPTSNKLPPPAPGGRPTLTTPD